MIFTGYYGMRNFGDDLFGLICLYGAAKYWGRGDAKLLAPPNIGMREDAFSVVGEFARTHYPEASLSGKTVRAWFALKESLFSDRVIFGGGSLFSSETSGARNLFRAVSNIRRKTFSAIGVSVGPFSSRNDEKTICEFLKKFEYISVRDQSSFEIIKNFQLDATIHNGADLAALGSEAIGGKEKSASNEKDLIGFSPCLIQGDSLRSKELNKIIVAGLIALSRKRSIKVLILNLNDHPMHGDDELSQWALEELKRRNVEVCLLNAMSIGVAETWRKIGICDAYVSVRLHGALSAYISKVPFALFEYHKKCTDFLNDIKKDDSLRLADSGFCDERVLEVLEALLNGAREDELIGQLAAYTMRARDGFMNAPWALS